MRRALFVGLLAAGSACVGFNIRASDDCATLCAMAANCGFLPSALGFSEGSIAEAQADCERRCAGSRADDPTAAQIVDCFAAPTTSTPRWCTSEAEADAEYAALWSTCAGVSACLARSFGDDRLRGGVSLTVQMIEWTEYQQHLGLELADYPGKLQGDARAIESCQPALCSSAVCSTLECELPLTCLADSTGADAGSGGPTGTDTGMTEEACSEVCELPAGEVCDTRLCRVGHLTISTFCEDMAVEKISLQLYERDRLPAVEVFVDVEAGINAKCETSTFEFDTGTYTLLPGPIKVTAKIEGTLTGAELALLGYFADDEAFEPDAPTKYCVEFVGPAMTTHAGSVEVAVPVGERDALVGRKGALWRRCLTP